MIRTLNTQFFYWLIGLTLCSTTYGALFDNVTFVNDTTCMFIINKIYLINAQTKNNITLPPNPSQKSVTCKKEESALNLKYTSVGEIESLDLRFAFNKDARSWYTSNTNISIKCTAGAKTCVNVDAGHLHLNWLTSPSKMSYKCSSLPSTKVLSSKGDSVPLSVYFYWLQFQPFDVTSGRFSSAVDCTGVFSIPIWSTLSVSFLLIGILSYGLVMLSAVQPNAQYDDPKSKLIQLGGNN